MLMIWKPRFEVVSESLNYVNSQPVNAEIAIKGKTIDPNAIKPTLPSLKRAKNSQ
jgi:hypothetical protein